MSFPLLPLLKNPSFISRKNMILKQIAIKKKKKKKKKKQLIVYKIMSETS